jgi:hypothetical protein
MRTVKVVCDRCGSPIIEGGSVVEATAGAIRGRVADKIDLCRDCGERFQDWLATPKAGLASLGAIESRAGELAGATAGTL